MHNNMAPIHHQTAPNDGSPLPAPPFTPQVIPQQMMLDIKLNSRVEQYEAVTSTTTSELRKQHRETDTTADTRTSSYGTIEIIIYTVTFA